MISVKAHFRRTKKGKKAKVRGYNRRTKRQKKSRQREFIEGGYGDGYPDVYFDRKQLLRGAKVEMEHTNNPLIAEEIAKDHLVEDSRYYEALENMENQLEKSRKKTWNKHLSRHYGMTWSAAEENELQDKKSLRSTISDPMMLDIIDEDIKKMEARKNS